MLHAVWNQNAKKWLIPLGTALAAFLISQMALLLFSRVFADNPLPFRLSSLASPHTGQFRDPSPNIQITADLQADIMIDSVGIKVPIVWSKNSLEQDLQKDLEQGSIHYPGTPLPGETGNAFITAHSSDYPWKKGNYKTAFSKLGKVNIGDEVTVIYKKNNAPLYQLKFRVKETRIVKATDPRMIEQGDKPEMTLVTCWPLGTNFLRLMVKTELLEDQKL